MKKPQLRAVAIALAAFALPIAGLADVSGTPTLAVNTMLNLDTGATASSGGDLLWNGSSVVPQAGVSVSSIPGGSAVYDSLDESILKVFPFSSAPVAFASLSNAVIAVKTKSGNYAKVLVTSVTQNGSLSLRFTTFASTATGPSITAVQNNFGLVPQGLPNYAIAPGALFFIQGRNLANTTTELLSSAAPGLQTSRSGVSVSVTVGGTTLQCPLYYLSPTQLDAVLPGATPLGTGTVTVTNNGTTSPASPIVVAQSAFGILSYNGTLGAVYDANNAILTSSNSANPNQVIVLWGSGVGLDSSNDDRLFPQKQNNLTNIPMQAFVGGLAATIAYRGRSQFPGVDQVVLTIPSGVPTGCYVSLVIVSGSIVSNSVTIPIAASGRTCSDPTSSLPPELLQTLSGKSTVREGFLTVSQSTTISAGSTRVDNSVAGIFSSVTGFGNSAGANSVSLGSCVVYNSTTVSGAAATTAPLDAGTAIGVTGPAGALTMPVLSVPGLTATFYSPTGVVPATFIPAAGGAFTFDNGSGGKDVQHFSATLNLPAAFTWTNQAQVTAVTRTQGTTVTWSGGAAGSYVSITGGSTATSGGTSISVTFSCQAPVSAGQFAVPVPVLLALPAGIGSLSVGDFNSLQLFQAPGLDLGILSGSNSTSKTLNYN